MTAVVATEDQFEQLIRLLAENPDLRARLRGALVGEELADFTERLARIAELQERSEKGMVELEERMRSWIASMQQHAEFLREMNAEDRRRQQEFGAYFEALLARMGERIDAINASIAAQAEQDARLGMRMDQLTARIDSLTERMDQLTARVDSLTERMEQLTARVDDLTQQVQQLTVRMDQLAARVDSLTERMEQLTARVDDLTQQVQQLTVRMDQLTARVDSLTERMDQLTARVDQLTVDTQRLTGEFGKLKGWQLEERYFRRAPAYFAPILRRIRALSPEELAELLDSLENAGQLSEAEVRDIQNADVVVRGRDRETGEERYLLVEVSVGVGLEDVERAARRANLLARALNVPVLPVVAGEYFRAEAMRAANELGVWKVLDGGCEPPKGDGSDKN